MATVTAAAAATAAVVRAAAVPRAPAAAASSPVLGLPQIRMRGGRVKCSARDEKAGVRAEGGAAALAAAAAGVVATAAGPARALVDERLTTEGTGLSLGISNNLLGWILLGVFGVIWALYFVYTSTLEEDEESGGLSL